mmetsp:Transcript_116156/g.339710  ORF Transcript_116156/g.339710 Transcript_116156/m.339710 type:complete len:111 (-) Transcript_116156:334-666(-)
MRELAAAMADERLPPSSDGQQPGERVDAASRALREAGGEHVLADAAGVIALFAAITIPVDAAGHSSKELAKVAPVMRGVARTRTAAEGLLLPVGMALGGLAVAVAAYAEW